MKNKQYRRFYALSLAALAALSAYPLINGARMAFLSLTNGSIEPWQYAKYVVPYTAICLAAILFAAFQPLLFKAGRLAFPAGLAGAWGVFFAAEQFFERIQIHSAGMSLIDPASLASSGPPEGFVSATADAWQASLCIILPPVIEQSSSYASSDRYLYVMADGSYKIHYYLISLVLITMVCGLVYGIGKMLRAGDRSGKKAIILQGVSAAALTALCVFANTTAFFRESQAIQTPLASVLTCLFFVVFGAAAGVYLGSFALRGGQLAGIILPAVTASAAVTLLYIGEAAMMAGRVYRFGRGFFFERFLPGLALAPVDIAVILAAGAAAWLILRAARKREKWPGVRTAAVSVALCALIAAAGVLLAPPSGEDPGGAEISDPSDISDISDIPDISDISGCYEFDACLYMSPLSSFLAFAMPYVYGIDGDGLIIADTDTGFVERFSAAYQKTPVPADEFVDSQSGLIFGYSWSGYKERWLRALLTSESGQKQRLYQMDGEILLVRGGENGGMLWSVYRLKRTDKATLSDLYRVMEEKTIAAGLRQMTLRDVLLLSEKGRELAMSDFEQFSGSPVGSGFIITRYDLEDANVLIVHSDTPESAVNYARLSKLGHDPFNAALAVDITEGPEAVYAYLDPLYSPVRVEIEDMHSYGTSEPELLYEFGGYRYYINRASADSITVIFEDGERMPLKQALEERRITVEMAVENGLYNVYMEPADNPMGGKFWILHHRHRFYFEDELFYPSATFMYTMEDSLEAYYNQEELALQLELHGYRGDAILVRNLMASSQIGMAGTFIAGKIYFHEDTLAAIGIMTEAGWMFSSHTPVRFTFGKPQPPMFPSLPVAP